MRFGLCLLNWFTQSRKWHWWLFLLLWLAVASPAQAAVLLRVAIEQGVSQVRVGSSTKAVVRDAAGRQLGQLTAMNAFYVQPSNSGVVLEQLHASALWIEPTGNGFAYIGDRWYRGKTLVVPDAQGLSVVNYVDLEQYLYSVLGSEMNGNWPQEALKAQAVAARTYAIYKQETDGNSIYDVGDTAAWQVYNGVASESPGTRAAVKSTSGQVLTYKNQIILAAFHACSGGHTENVEDVWSQPLPYLRGVQDFDRDISACQWEKILSTAEINQRIAGVGNVLSLNPSFTPYGSIKTIKFVGDRGTRELKGNDVRNAFGLRSTRFTITAEPSGLRVAGRGWGHALGMSQWGAYNLAKHGVNYLQILGHYYRGTSLAKIQPQ